MPGKYKIVMIRHGESEWNQKNLFCGWFDADLSDKGEYLVLENCFTSLRVSFGYTIQCRRSRGGGGSR